MDRVTLTKQAKESSMSYEYEQLRKVIEGGCGPFLEKLENTKIDISISKKLKTPRVNIHYQSGKIKEVVTLVESLIKSCGFYPYNVEYIRGCVYIEFEK